jgi:hypothetical protein
MNTKNLRDYGLPKTQEAGVPTWTPTDPPLPCPNCGGQLAQVQVKVTMKLLRGGEGMSNYLGCPACPYASPAMCVSMPAHHARTSTPATATVPPEEIDPNDLRAENHVADDED